MNPACLGVALLALGLCAGAADDLEKKAEKRPADVEALKGKWVVTRAVQNGAINPRMVGRTRYFFGDSCYVMSNDYTVNGEGDYKLDSTKTPAWIDMVPESTNMPNQVHWHGIYELDGDILKLSISSDEGRRPKTFDSKRGSNEFVTILKRVKD